METEPIETKPTLVQPVPQTANTNRVAQPGEVTVEAVVAGTPSSLKKKQTKPSSSVLVWRWVGATLLILLGAVTAPLTVFGMWVKDDVLNTEKFVETYAPLGQDPQFQAFMAEQVSAVATEQVIAALPVDALEPFTSGISNFLGVLPFGSGWSETVDAIPENIDESIENLIHETATEFVTSNAFEPLWATMLREVHSEIVGTMSGAIPLTDPQADLTFISINTAPLVETLKAELQAEGVWWAQFIPVVDKEMEIVQITDASALQTANRFLNASPTIFVVLGLVLALLGVALAPSRSFAVALVGIFVAAAAALSWQGIQSWGLNHIYTMAGESEVPLSTKLWDTTTQSLFPMLSSVIWAALAVALIGLAVAVIVHFRASKPRSL